MKSTVRREHMVVASFSSNEDDLSLDADQVEAPAPTRDAAFSSVVSQHKGGVSSQQNQFTYIAATNDTITFSYIEATGRGPSNWGQLDPKWKACGDGKLQSPIDLLDQNVKVLYGQEDQLRRDYKPAKATIVSRGYDVMVSWKGDAGKITINGTDYNLQHSHWHVPSEHTFNSKTYDMELHIVHANSLGETAVVGVLYKYGEPDPFLSKLSPYIKSVTKQEKSLGILSPNKIEFGSRNLYRYIGSLSTPPCSEGVIWTVVKEVGTVSREQVQLLRDAVDDGYQANARPVQPLNGRVVNLFIRSMDF
ncbi:PREDICTED: alpha carbonic anhydrase 4-like [Populus euphratica]|uniref:Alpha carbonic anhydrase 4-like n=1 Tax=Populus euphratica TaxID=75702 RepID=A0AAJ6VJ80_POPEU|nr:PREDICTED: alpha carbonic anhydrase 4-like [Populus euphratica]